jgi:uncharacterized protein YcbX
MKAVGVLEDIFTYPLKSCKWLTHSQIVINEMGLHGDRQFMLVDPDGKFLTQRQIPSLAKVQVMSSNMDIELTVDGETEKFIHQRLLFKKVVSVWEDTLTNSMEHPKISEWMSTKLGRDIHFVERPTSKIARTKYIPKTQETIGLSLVDGYPVHIVNLASLKDLESKTEMEISPMRFRPNLLISGLAAYEEENLDIIQGKDFSLKIIKPTGRCAIPNIDPMGQTIGKEPMRTLATFKTSGNNVTFGVYATVLKTGKALSGEDLSFHFSLPDSD